MFCNPALASESHQSRLGTTSSANDFQSITAYRRSNRHNHNCHTLPTYAMASAKSLMMLAGSRPGTALSRVSRTPSPTTIVFFSTSIPRAATPAGPPPPGFRLSRPKRWDESSESALDKAGKYFLLMEMMRGMWVSLEQFFRPP